MSAAALSAIRTMSRCSGKSDDRSWEPREYLCQPHMIQFAVRCFHINLRGFKPQNQTFFHIFQTGQNVQEWLGSGAFSAIGEQSLFRELSGGRH